MPACHRGAEQVSSTPDDRIVGADLPDHQPRPAGLQRALQPSQGLGGEFAADPGVLHVEVRARLLFELRFEPGRIGVRRRTRPDTLVEDEPIARMSFGRPTRTFGNAAGAPLGSKAAV